MQTGHTWIRARSSCCRDARVARPSLAVAPDGPVFLTWNEGPPARPATYAARFVERFEALGGALDAARASLPRALALDPSRGPVVLLQDTGSGPVLLRDNGSPTPPFGLDRRAHGNCSIPADDDPDFPRTLSATGCFDDVPARVPAAGLTPYSVNAPLWSDGARKRRFFVLPAGESIGYRDRDAWTLPVGTVLVKEFLLQTQAGAIPMETRFLVKRCEPGSCRAAWQGYSYEWNDAGSEARLLDNRSDTVFKDWSVGSEVHRHSYPGPDECTRCHATAAGGALGLQTGQLNKRHDYGAQVDNQIRALAHQGVFGDSLRQPTQAQLGEMPRLPRPYDAAEGREAQVRAYLHANCSHCHRPDGRWPVVDLRFRAELRAANDESPNLCDTLVPGDAAASLLYLKIRSREPDLPEDFQGDPMPPLATLTADPRQVPVIAAWIEGMATCP